MESNLHQKSDAAWQENVKRHNLKTTIGNLLHEKQIENNRYYIKSIAEVIQFLAVNELGFRESYDEDFENESGLFRNLFEF